jgi:inhibitor of KinA
MMIKIYPLSESSITIEFGSAISFEINQKVIAFRKLLLSNPFDGLIEVVAAYSTLTVFYDPVRVSGFSSPLSPAKKVEEILFELSTRSKEIDQQEDSEVISIPVCYDKEFALDLQWLADFHKVSEKDIIKHHIRSEYAVFMIGFMPGFPYMGILPETLESPRKQTPRTLVPAGSVGIAGRQTGIYPFDSPGGWQIVGRTPLKLFSTDAKKHSLLQAGDRVQFLPISKDEFKQLAKA